MVRGRSLPEKLERCQYFLQSWARHRYDNLGKQIKDLRKKRAKILNDNATKSVREEMDQISAEIEKLTDMEETHWKQRSRVNWLGQGDRNTAYFHGYASGRKKKNNIRSLQDDRGLMVFEDLEKARVIKDYFNGLFTTNGIARSDLDEILACNIPRVPDDICKKLEEPFTADEIKRAVFQMHPTKSPGPDGFSPVFFQKFWPMIGGDCY